MFSLTYTEESEIQGIITFKGKRNWGLGNHKDINGNLWNVWGWFGGHCWARLDKQMHPYFSDTSNQMNYGLVSQKWLPYKVEWEES